LSDTDSFLQEVSEELRRDKLYKNMRKYGWIGLLLVVIIVGGAAYREYQKSQAAQRAQLFGSNIINALNEKNSKDRISKLQEIKAPSDNAKAVLTMLVSAEANNEEASSQDLSNLADVLEDLDVDAHYRDLLKFKILLGSAEKMALDERKSAFLKLSEPGNPFRLLAEEQLILIELEQGKIDSAIEKISQVLLDAEITVGLRNRATQMLIALGKDPSEAQ
jgi:hypothetical protein